MGRVSRTAASTGKPANRCWTFWPIRSRTGERHGAATSANAWPEGEARSFETTTVSLRSRLREYHRVAVGDGSRFAPDRSRSAAAADALDLLVERRVFLAYRIVRVTQVLFVRHVARARLTMADRGLNHTASCGLGCRRSLGVALRDGCGSPKQNHEPHQPDDFFHVAPPARELQKSGHIDCVDHDFGG